jgi:N-terminal acetyltransferase B complex non-catalytic subunit
VLDGTFSYVTKSNSPDDAAEDECGKHIERTQKVFEEIAAHDGKKDRSGPLGLLELERRARVHEFDEGIDSGTE